MKKCKTCKYYEPFNKDAVGGYCRRFPPVGDNRGSHTVDSFPTVSENDWCGEHKKK